MNSKILLVTACLFSSPFWGRAQKRQDHPDTLRFKELTEVTVSALRQQERILQVPRSVTVYTSKDFRELPFQSVADLLGRAEGVYALGTQQNPGALQSLYLRGADNRQTLILVDGIRLSDAATPDNSLDLSEISLTSVERIEIVRGAQGTLYGSSAIGGTINIITKKGGLPGLHGHGEIRAGTYGAGTAGLTGSGGLSFNSKGGFYLGGDFFRSANRGLNATVDTVKDQSVYHPNERDNFYKTDYSVRAGLKQNDWDLSLSYRGTRQQSDIDDGAYMDDPARKVHFDRDLLSYSVQKKFNKISVRLFGGYTRTSRADVKDSVLVSLQPLAYDGNTLQSTYSGKYFTQEAQVNYSFNKLSLVGGGGYLQERMNVHSSYYSSVYQYSSETNYDTLGLKAGTWFAYGRGSYQIPLGNKSLTLGAGLRYSHHSRFGDFLSFEFNPALKLSEQVEIYANLSRGFNAPSLYQLFAPEKDFTSGISRGNDLLQPEKSFTYEAGFKSILGEKFLLNLSLYRSVVKDYIDYVYLWNKNTPQGSLGFGDYLGDTYLNTGEMTNTGFELATKYLFSNKWELAANLSINNGELKYQPAAINTLKTGGNYVQVYGNGAFLSSDITQKDLVRRPGRMGNVSLVYRPLPPLKLMLDVRYTGPRPDIHYDPSLGPFGALARSNVAGFTLANVAAFYSFNPHLRASLQVNNILDTHYQEIFGFTTLGRSLWGALQFDF